MLVEKREWRRSASRKERVENECEKRRDSREGVRVEKERE